MFSDLEVFLYPSPELYFSITFLWSCLECSQCNCNQQFWLISDWTFRHRGLYTTLSSLETHLFHFIVRLPVSIKRGWIFMQPLIVHDTWFLHYFVEICFHFDIEGCQRSQIILTIIPFIKAIKEENTQDVNTFDTVPMQDVEDFPSLHHSTSGSGVLSNGRYGAQNGSSIFSLQSAAAHDHYRTLSSWKDLKRGRGKIQVKIAINPSAFKSHISS